jgi:cardiolipin synthase
MYLFLKPEIPKVYATVVVGISSLTDMFDGLIARKFNMITELGKLIDPLADKLTQGALIICFLLEYPLMWVLMCIYFVKECFMAAMGLIILRKNGQKLNGANMYGKVSTAMVYIVMFLFLLIYDLPLAVVNTLIIICAASTLLALVSYIPAFVKLYRLPKEDDKASR